MNSFLFQPSQDAGPTKKGSLCRDKHVQGGADAICGLTSLTCVVPSIAAALPNERMEGVWTPETVAPGRCHQLGHEGRDALGLWPMVSS
jgi:hypothetical protein